MTSYESEVGQLAMVTFEACHALAQKRVPPYSSSLPLYRELNRGTLIPATEEQLNAYFAYYGDWHRKKLGHVLPHVPPTVFSHSFDLIDWGSGQGIGLLALGDYIGENSQYLRNATLIDPSEIALERAELHAQFLFPSAIIRKVNKKFEDLESTDFVRQIPVPRIHLFSNVLDMNLFHNLADVALKSFFQTVRAFAFGADEYFLCVSPSCNGVSDRFERFLDIIKDDERWTLERLFRCSITTSRPTLAADIVHYKSKILGGSKHYSSETGAPELFYELAAANDVEGLKVLVEKGADVNKPDAHGLVPILHAAKSGAHDATAYLLAQGADPNATGPHRATALYFASKCNDIKLMSYLLNSGADMEISVSTSGNTPLMIAIRHSYAAAVRLLLDSGCRLDGTDIRKLSPMKLAEIYATDEIQSLIRQRTQS